jgi:hypothetical protein
MCIKNIKIKGAPGKIAVIMLIIFLLIILFFEPIWASAKKINFS